MVVKMEKNDIKLKLNDKISIVVEVEEVARPRKRRCSISKEKEKRDDPMEILGEDLMRKILGYLDGYCLAQILLVSKTWFLLASSDHLWSPLCDQLWIGKAHIPRWSKVPGLSKLASYSRAMIDSRRVCVLREDLWDHAWDFHFTEAAPNYWKDLDPYWGRVGSPMRRHFHPDGSVTADPEDIVWGGHECTYSIVTRSHADKLIGENYVRINRWPPLTVSRRKDWGWEMSNFVCTYSSVPDSSKGGSGPMFYQESSCFF